MGRNTETVNRIFKREGIYIFTKGKIILEEEAKIKERSGKEGIRVSVTMKV